MVNKPVGKSFVFKRDGRKEEVHLDKITSRISKLCDGLSSSIDPLAITLKVLNGLYPGVTTVELDNLAAEMAIVMAPIHPDYAILAARIAISNLHKETKEKFSDVIEYLYNNVQEKTDLPCPRISDYYYKIIMENADRLNSCIVHDRDYEYNYFGLKTLERSYLMQVRGKIVERPQHMLMRAAIGIHGDDIESAVETYKYLSERYFSHASPTLFSAATPRAQLSSCFLHMVPDDSLKAIFDCITNCAHISKSAGGIGLSIHNIRASGSYIAGTGGTSSGIIPMLRVFNHSARYIDQGGNKRPGAIAMYLEPWHADIFDFLELKKNTGKDEMRARDLFYALWVPDLFMKRVEANEKWSLMCPNHCPGLSDSWGDKFETLYMSYEKEGRYSSQVDARSLWSAICISQMETGGPYMLYKDACNRKSNQQNLGTIKSSNLCTEIIEYTAADEIAMCNLASIAVNKFVDNDKYDFELLKKMAKLITRNLNKIIDINYYPVPEAKTSNLKHRPIGIGVQGLADAFILAKIPFESEAAKKLNIQIFETIYYGALEASCELAEVDGPYSTYVGSPVSKGNLQYDLWGVSPTSLWDWDALKTKISKYGIRNSLLLAQMPTAATAEILGNNEAVEPYTSNISTRKTLSGEFQVLNQHLFKDLTKLGLWDDEMQKQIIDNHGSIQNISKIPSKLKQVYKTVWEIPQKVIIDMAADRGAFIDQSQSLNIHMERPVYGKVTSMHFYGWKKGLKTGMYYLRSKAATKTIESTVDQVKVSAKEEEVTNSTEEAALACSLNNPGACEMCGA